jgi:hypothetical protein
MGAEEEAERVGVEVDEAVVLEAVEEPSLFELLLLLVLLPPVAAALEPAPEPVLVVGDAGCASELGESGSVMAIE